MLDNLLKKENILLVVILACIVLYFWGKKLNENKQTQKIVEWLPVIGGLTFGFNTLIQLAK